MKVELFCICGAGAEGEISPEPAADRFRSFWDQFHKGPEHRPCTREEAAAAFAAQNGGVGPSFA